VHGTHGRPATPAPASGSLGRREQRAIDQETVPILDTSAERADGAVVETGTTVVGATAGEAVVVGADRRASLGGRLVTSKDVRKVEPVHPTAAVGFSGAVGHIQGFVRTLRTEASLYADRRGDPPSIPALATLAGNILRTQPLRVTPVLGGVDDDGAHLFGVDEGGGVLSDEYTAAGSGTQVAYGVLERRYDPSAGVEAARETVAAAVAGASERDTASGDGLTLATVTAEGVETEVVADPGEVA
jgi:proteasome beta subunit